MTNVNLNNAQHIRVTCEQATINNLTLDIEMAKKDSLQSSEKTTDSQPLVAKDHADDGKFHLLLAASGSVATIKIPNIVRGLSKLSNVSIRIILTGSASKFLDGQSHEQPDLKMLSNYPHVDAIYLDSDEWKKPWVRGDPILHIELRRWADLMVIAPLSANTLAKISNGLCDNLLTSVIRAWEVQPPSPTDHNASANGTTSLCQKRIVVAPAMNTAMWRHPLTSLHLKQIKSLFHWFDVMKPIEKELACGDSGDGAMCDWNDIVSAIERRIVYEKTSNLT